MGAAEIQEVKQVERADETKRVEFIPDFDVSEVPPLE